MKKTTLMTALAVTLTAAAACVPLTSSATAAPADFVSCTSTSTTDGCTTPAWTADVLGSFYVATSGTWEVDQKECTTDPTTGVITCTWVPVIVPSSDGGINVVPGNVDLQTGVLIQMGAQYRLAIKGAGGGAVGSITGQPSL